MILIIVETEEEASAENVIALGRGKRIVKKKSTATPPKCSNQISKGRQGSIIIYKMKRI